MADNAPFPEFPIGSADRLRLVITYLRAASGKLTAIFADMTDDDPTDPKYKPLADVIHILDEQQDQVRGLMREAQRQQLRRETGG